MMKRILLITYFFASFSAFGQAPAFEWVKQLGGSGQSGHDITTDKDGNVYVTGDFRDTTDFDPGPDSFNLIPVSELNGSSSTDIFVAKYGSDGQFLWAVSFGDDDSDRGFSIATDTIGNVYVTGTFQGTIDFDPGPGVYFLSQSISGFILKLDTNGSFVWVGELDTFLNSEFAMDEASNLYLTGSYGGTDDFDPGPEVYNVTGSGSFVLKLDKDRNFLWVKTIETDGFAGGDAVGLDSLGNIYVIGEFSGAVDFDAGPDEFILTEVGPTGRDGFVLKLNSEGDFIWAKQIGGLDDVHLHWPQLSGIVVDGDSEGVYVTGSFDETCDFDPGPDTFNLVANGISDFFVLKLDFDGNFIWAKSAGGESSNGGGGIVIDEDKNLYIVGMFRATIEFNSGNDSFNLSTLSLDINTRNVYILKLDTDGNYQWAGAFLSDENNGSNSIALDSWGNIYTTGSFSHTADFDPDTSSHVLNGSGLFIHKMRQPCYVSPSINISNNIFAICSGDSVSLEVSLPSFSEEPFYLWNTGDTTNSIVKAPVSSLTYNLSISYSDNNIACTFSDSVEVVVLEIPDTNYIELTSCDSLAIGAVEYAYEAENGCDSIVIETTALIPLPETPIIPENLLIQENDPPFQLIVPEVSGATSYLWIVPPGVEITTGNGTNSITVDWKGLTTGGSICVSALNECGSSVTACLEVTVDIVDALEEMQPKGYRIFPNPAADRVNIIFEETKFYEIVVLDNNSRLVDQIRTTSKHILIPTHDLAPGSYWLKIIDKERVYWERIVVIK
ncbi:MAG: hypothetical protein ACI8XB_002265 [Patiriisocius sp.]|jgi:hypothetical protein